MASAPRSPGLADRGAAVAGLARRVGRVAELGDGVTPVVADVTDPASLTAAFDRVTQELGGPDLVVANAGVAYGSAVDDVQPSDWQRQVDVNVSGVVATATAALPHLVAAAAEGRPADLVVISSVSDVVMFPSLAAYSATKAAVTALTRGLRPDLVVRGVRTLNVRPGLVATEIAGGAARRGPRRARRHHAPGARRRGRRRVGGAGHAVAREHLRADDHADEPAGRGMTRLAAV